MGLYLVYEQIVNYYVGKITARELVAGEMLESEEKTAERFEVSRGTVRKAFNYLRHMGVITSCRGRRSVVAENALEAIRGMNIAVSLTHKRICLMFINDGEYLGYIIRLVQDRARTLGWVCDVMFNSDELSEQRCISEIIEKRYDGVICTPYRERGVFEIRNFQRLQKAGIPFVMIGKTDVNLFCDAVYSDDYRGSYRITGNLIDSKCSLAVHITDFKMDRMTARERENGYIEAMKFYKKQAIVLDCNDREFGKKLSEIVKERRAGRLGFNLYSDAQVASLMPILEKFNLKEKKDYKIICFRELFEMDNSKFDTVDISRREIGLRALNILKDRIENGYDNSSVTHVVFNIAF